ncbi:two-component system sensor histidine kinase PmrB [Pectobacterium sp. CFBP8739]|uniref:two-component system sensor histidine kinase PmrB n=1 Tax=unclassified Pectobacterium TaxID=2627739 RepID=UPI0015E01F06|nr:two-component system sensor histidine kinase PmrB [Pectobacterium sp. CFBP8739]MBA0168642.1 two-component system sensor histidine kinase PmrB [Pectobacterium sp. CFBP8739]
MKDDAVVSMRLRLVLTLGGILLVCQMISVLWLWHESEEQISLLVDRSLSASAQNMQVEQEIHEALASLSIPSLVMVILTLLMCAQAVSWITRPLSRLQEELQERTAENLEPLPQQSDIKEIAAVTHSINQLFQRLDDTLKRDRRFTADVAHELRTPLSGIRLHLELHQQQHQIDCSALIKRIDKMVKTVEQLLLLARVGQSFSAGHHQNVAFLKDVIFPMQDELAEMLQKRQQTLKFILPHDDTAILGDATLLQLLLRNLVENAYRYSPEASQITVSLKTLQHLELQVEDEGPGIDESKVGELSKAFVRMDSRYGGIGLGLSIVTRIAQLHDGQFFLSNRPQGSGTLARVVLTIPDESLNAV